MHIAEESPSIKRHICRHSGHWPAHRGDDSNFSKRLKVPHEPDTEIPVLAPRPYPCRLIVVFADREKYSSLGTAKDPTCLPLLRGERKDKKRIVSSRFRVALNCSKHRNGMLLFVAANPVGRLFKVAERFPSRRVLKKKAYYKHGCAAAKSLSRFTLSSSRSRSSTCQSFSVRSQARFFFPFRLPFQILLPSPPRKAHMSKPTRKRQVWSRVPVLKQDRNSCLITTCRHEDVHGHLYGLE